MPLSVRERDYETESYRGDHKPRSVTVKRYQVPDRERDDDRWETSSRISRHDDRTNVREYRFERDVSRGPPPVERDLYEYRGERAPSPPGREIRITREISRDPPRREYREDYGDLERYSKTTDYYGRQEEPRPIVIRQQAPQPIIIREEAPARVIIKERAASPKLELVEKAPEREVREDAKSVISRRSDQHDDRQIARRDPNQDNDDEYYFQKTTRQVARRPEPDQRDDYDDYQDYRRQRNVRPRDSVSNRGDEEDDYYYKRTETYDDSPRGSSPKHRRHLAEGAVAGLGAAALLNHHNKQEGGKGRNIGKLVGGAALGTVGAELVTRARSRYRGADRSRSRSRSGSREPRQRGRGRRDVDGSRSRSKSKSRFGTLEKLGAVAVVGAIAGYALTRNGKNKEVVEDRRSRSRKRRSSTTRSLSRSLSGSRTRDPEDKHDKNSTIAKAGLASAAVAGLVDHARNKSKGGRSRSRLRQGIPIAAAGLGGAAIAGLYENNKTKKERKVRAEREKVRSLSRDRSQSRPRSAYDSRGIPSDDQNLITYGGEPVPQGDQYGAHPMSRAGSYNEGRRRGSPASSDESPRRRRYVNEQDEAAGAGVAGVAAHESAQRLERKRAERERRRQEDEQAGYGFGPYAQEPPQGEYAGNFYQQPQEAQQYAAPMPNSYAAPNNGQYPSPNPPYSPGAPYDNPNLNTAPYAPQQGYAPPQAAPQQGSSYGYHPQGPPEGPAAYNVGAGYTAPPNNVSMPPNAPPDAAMGHVESRDLALYRPHTPEDLEGRRTPKTVAFNMNHDIHTTPLQSPIDGGFYEDEFPQNDGANDTEKNHTGRQDHDSHDGAYDDYDRNEEILEEEQPRRRRSTREQTSDDSQRPRNKRRHTRRHSESGQGRRRDRHDLDDESRDDERAQSASPIRGRRDEDEAGSQDSGETVELPPRFHQDGRRKPERGDDPLSDKLNDIFAGKGTLGKVFHKFAGKLSGSSGKGRRR